MDVSQYKGVFITATDTEIGKTLVCGGLARALRRRGRNANVLKPFGSGGTPNPDAVVLSEWLGGAPTPEQICPLSFEQPLAPYTIVRRNLGKPDIQQALHLVRESLEHYDITCVEGIGGVLVPLLRDYSVLDFICELRVPVILVSRAGLGTINHSLLSIAQLKQRDVSIAGFITNQLSQHDADASIQDNAEIIAELGGISHLGHIPYCANNDDIMMRLDTIFDHITSEVWE